MSSSSRHTAPNAAPPHHASVYACKHDHGECDRASTQHTFLSKREGHALAALFSRAPLRSSTFLALLGPDLVLRGPELGGGAGVMGCHCVANPH